MGINVSPWQKRIGQVYLDACEYDVTAFKPGNVSIFSEGHGMTVADFRNSAVVSEPMLIDVNFSVGEKIYRAVQASWNKVGCNTNLGIILLCAPMIQAAQDWSKTGSFKAHLQQVLDSTTQQDADWVYRAIRLVSPGGLGQSEEQDVQLAPEVTLTEAMGIACERDRIAWQYVNCFKDVLDFGLKRYHMAFNRWGDVNWAVAVVYIGLLMHIPDSHIERKFGNKYNGLVRTRMTVLDEALSKTERPEQVNQLLHDIDAEFKSLGINPGTTADLTVATLLAVGLDQSLRESNE